MDLVHLAGVVHLLPGDAHHPCGHAHGGGVGGDLAEYHRVGGDAGVVPHLEGAQHLGPGGHHHVVAQGGVALALVLAGAAQGDPVVDQAVVADLRRLADDNAHAVVDDEPAADPGAGVDLNAGPEPAPLAHQPGNEEQPVPVEEVGQPVVQRGMHPRIEQENLQPAPGRRVPGLIGPQGLSQSCQRKHLPDAKKRLPCQGAREAGNCRGSTLISHSGAGNGARPGASGPLRSRTHILPPHPGPAFSR